MGETCVVLPYPWATLEPPKLPQGRWRNAIMKEALAAAQRSHEAMSRAHREGGTVRGSGEFAGPPGVRELLDWLNALEEEDPRMLDKLPKISWSGAVEHCRRWHERLAAMRADRKAGDVGTVERIEVHSPAGWYWTHLVTKRALDNEGAAMGHCVGSRSYDRYAWDTTDKHENCPALGIWSLRDGEGRSHVTVEILPNGIMQAKGPKNATPTVDTCPAFGPLIDRVVPAGETAVTPSWLMRETDGTTRYFDPLNEMPRSGLTDTLYEVHYGQVMFRRAGSREPFIILDEVDEVDVGDISRRPVRLQRYRVERSPLARDVVASAIDSMVTMTVRSASGFVEAMGRMFAPDQNDGGSDIVRMHLGLPWEDSRDELRSLSRGHDPVCCGAAASPPRLARSVPGKIKRDPDTGMPWFRQHERERTGRRW
ncbi:hypothetical protein ACFQ12_01435 [Methylobacterium trifolii]